MSIYQVVHKGQYGNTAQTRYVWHYEFPGYVPTAPELQEFVDNLDGILDELFKPLLSSQWSSIAYDVRRVDVGDLPTVEYVATTQPWNGSSSSSLLPRQTALLVRWAAPTAYPRTARTYFAGWPESANDTNGTAVLAITAAAALVGSAMEEIEVTGQVDAQKTTVQYGGTPRVVTDSNQVFYVSTAATWRTQRRRVPGVGI